MDLIQLGVEHVIARHIIGTSFRFVSYQLFRYLLNKASSRIYQHFYNILILFIDESKCSQFNFYVFC